MLYTGGFFSGTGLAEAFAGSNASVGLMLGSFFALVITIVLFLIRRVMTFGKCMNCLPEGFKAMVPAILILTFAWTLKSMTDDLAAGAFVAEIVKNSAAGFMNFLPAVIFLIGCLLSFATGTSWGTFGILIPIVVEAFQQRSPPAAEYRRSQSLPSARGGTTAAYSIPCPGFQYFLSAQPEGKSGNILSSARPESFRFQKDLLLFPRKILH